jgi:hypothetical protein
MFDVDPGEDNVRTTHVDSRCCQTSVYAKVCRIYTTLLALARQRHTKAAGITAF